MKAVRLLEYGGQLVFDDVPTPTIARDEVLVKIRSRLLPRAQHNAQANGRAA
jgi:NADPH:quinone reductase-like Zn-dependent oxidoreductase